jgi:hypothetical protein
MNFRISQELMLNLKNENIPHETFQMHKAGLKLFYLKKYLASSGFFQ